MLGRSLNTPSSNPPVTAAVLRDELNLALNDFHQELSKDWQRLFQEHKDHIDDHLFHKHLPPRPDFAHADSKKMSLSRPQLSMQPRTTESTERNLKKQSMGHSHPHLSPSASGRFHTARSHSHSVVGDPAYLEADEDEDHKFLKRNPLVPGRKTERPDPTVAALFRQSWFGSGHSDQEHGGFQLLSSGPTDRRSSYPSVAPDTAIPAPSPSAPSEAPEQGGSGFRELRLSAGETKAPTRSATHSATLSFEDPVEVIEYPETPRRSLAKQIVHSKCFEHSVCVMVLLNAAILGVETESQWEHHRANGNNGIIFAENIEVAEAFFCVIFVGELVLRMLVDGCSFFTGQEWAWNLYDLVAIGLQLLEQASTMCLYFSSAWSRDMTSVMKDINILRVIRITRLIRVVRLLEELRMIVASICSSMLSLGWTFLLLMMLLYSLALFFTEIVLQNIHNSEHGEDMAYWFGGLWRTLLTLFECIFGGVSWDEVINPLIMEVSPLLGMVFCSYIAFCVLAMMNMATGVFVDNAMRKAQEDKDTNTAKRISDLFFNDPVLGQAESITEEQFCSKIDTPEMQDYFKAINVDPSEAKGLYRLLDADQSGSIDAAEMVAGCLRLRGGAKALELSLLMHEVSRMNKRHVDFQARMEKILAWVVEVIDMEPCRHTGSVAEEEHEQHVGNQPTDGAEISIAAAPSFRT